MWCRGVVMMLQRGQISLELDLNERKILDRSEPTMIIRVHTRKRQTDFESVSELLIPKHFKMIRIVSYST